MISIRPLIKVLSKIIELPSNAYLDPKSLGSGDTDITKVLNGDSEWVTPESMGYVPYTGATQDVDLGTHKITADAVEFNLTPVNAAGAGQVVYDGASGALSYLLNNSNVVSKIGQTMHAYVHNAEAVTITKGQAVYLFSASGNKASVKLAYNTSDATSAKTFGLAAEDIGAGQNGMVICQGVLDGLNTNMFSAGNTLYLGATAGSYTATKPYAPNHLVYIGIVERANAGNGQIYVKTQNGYELDELHDVDLITTPPVAGNVLTYNGSLWVGQAPSGGGISDGDKGDITVSGSGSVWTIDNNAVTNAKVNDVSVTKVTGTKSEFDTACTDGNFLFVGNLSGAIGITIDGGSSPITTGVKGYIVVPNSRTITGWYIVGSPSGSIVVDVWKANASIPTVANTITGTEKPTLSSSQYNSDLSLSSWSTSLVAGDVIAFNVDSASSITKATITIVTTS